MQIDARRAGRRDGRRPARQVCARRLHVGFGDRSSAFCQVQVDGPAGLRHLPRRGLAAVPQMAEKRLAGLPQVTGRQGPCTRQELLDSVCIVPQVLLGHRSPSFQTGHKRLCINDMLRVHDRNSLDVRRSSIHPPRGGFLTVRTSPHSELLFTCPVFSDWACSKARAWMDDTGHVPCHVDRDAANLRRPKLNRFCSSALQTPSCQRLTLAWSDC